uniref:Arrestin domain-containing protein 2-like n=1 Tax=Saccoglossus kowalevskii TaxID=10224 RepID=A0ABM0MKY2_SACKO|nr:PREDICTED: arrestin domain-containing protein 2-like [Saccoglossus kowalevskii]
MSGKIVLGFATVNEIVYVVSRDKKHDCIRVSLRGDGRVHWREKLNVMPDKKRTTTFHGNEQFLCERKTIWGKEPHESGEIPLLQAGQYSFPFSFVFPKDSNLPCSFECGKIAFIRYYVQTNMDISWAVDPVAERYFSFVGSPIDCNLVGYQKTLHAADRKTLCCCWCCGRGPIALKAELQRTAYCPGEYINIKTKLDNNSDKVMKLGVKLVQSVTINADSPKKTSKSGSYEILAYTSPRVLPYQEYTLHTARMIQIPVLPPSVTTHVIQMNYVIEVSLLIDEKNELEIYFPIVIGNVPYIDVSPTASPKEITYGHTAPSSCGAMTEDIQYSDGENITQLKPFAPLYVVLANTPLFHSSNGNSLVNIKPNEMVQTRTITRINSRERDGVFIRVNSRQEYSNLPKLRAVQSVHNTTTKTETDISRNAPINNTHTHFGKHGTSNPEHPRKRFGIFPTFGGTNFPVKTECNGINKRTTHSGGTQDTEEHELLTRSQVSVSSTSLPSERLPEPPDIDALEYGRVVRPRDPPYRISGHYV